MLEGSRLAFHFCRRAPDAASDLGSVTDLGKPLVTTIFGGDCPRVAALMLSRGFSHMPPSAPDFFRGSHFGSPMAGCLARNRGTFLLYSLVSVSGVTVLSRNTAGVPGPFRQVAMTARRVRLDRPWVEPMVFVSALRLVSTNRWSCFFGVPGGMRAKPC